MEDAMKSLSASNNSEWAKLFGVDVRSQESSKSDSDKIELECKPGTPVAPEEYTFRFLRFGEFFLSSLLPVQASKTANGVLITSPMESIESLL